MKAKIRYLVFCILGLTLLLLPVTMAGAAEPAQPAPVGSITGTLSIIWGDPAPGSTAAPVTRYYLTDAAGNTTELTFTEASRAAAGNLYALNGRQITVSGAPDSAATDAPGGNAPLRVTDVVPVVGQPAAASPVLGSQSFVTIACQYFNDYSQDKSIAYLSSMYGAAYPALDHYWREASYNQIDLLGSAAYGWFMLDYTYQEYQEMGNYRDALFRDCTAMADDDVNFALYDGIIMVFNSDVGGNSAWGGTSVKTNLDGVNRNWPVAWLPPWGYRNINVTNHEIGHAFGLPHSANSLGESHSNFWDLMSRSWSLCGDGDPTAHPTFGCIPAGTISSRQGLLGWIPAARKYTAVGGSQTITLERLAQPGAGNYLMAQINIGGSTSHFYTVESRGTAGYDNELVGSGTQVIIHEVVTYREEPAYVIDIDNDGDTTDAETIWTVGETFTSPDGKITVRVDSATATGHVVTITALQPQVTDTLVSLKANKTLGSVAARPEDIISRDDGFGAWVMMFDGSLAGISKSIEGFEILTDGSLIFSLKAKMTVPGLGAVSTQDVIRFTPAAPGNYSSGTFAWVLDASDVGLTTGAEAIDGVAVAPDGRLVISTTGAATVNRTGGGTLKAADEDLLVYDGTFGATSAGTLNWYVDGSDIGLTALDVRDAWINPTNGDISLSLDKAFTVNSVSGDAADVVRCGGETTGEATACATWAKTWAGSDRGLTGGALGIDGFSLGKVTLAP